MSTATAPLAEVDALTRSFGAFTAVDRVSLHVAPGEVVGLLGANGAGKTTVIRMLLGVLAPTTGRASLFGGVPSRASRGRLGYVPQGLGIYDDLTVRENLSFVAAAFGVATPTPSGALVPVADRLAGEIGLGRQRQLAFACALCHSPELLVMDEPTSGVDPLSRAGLWDQIRSAAERGVGALVTTHYLEEAEQCDRLIVMASGRIALAGTLAEIVGGRRAVLVRAERWDHAFQALADAGLPVTLSGRDTRVAGSAVDAVRTALTARGVTAELDDVPATLEETMVVVGG